MSDILDVRREAKLSDCSTYRYSLGRRWYPDELFSPARIGHPIPLIFVMLNPSTADAYEDDPTIRRCLGFARREGFEWLKVINLYAGRATKPADLFEMADPYGPDNNEEWATVRDMALKWGAIVVCAWGANPKAQSQAARFMRAMNGVPLHCLDITKSGAPKHPLYIKQDQPLKPFTPQQGSSDE